MSCCQGTSLRGRHIIIDPTSSSLPPPCLPLWPRLRFCGTLHSGVLGDSGGWGGIDAPASDPPFIMLICFPLMEHFSKMALLHIDFLIHGRRCCGVPRSQTDAAWASGLQRFSCSCFVRLCACLWLRPRWRARRASEGSSRKTRLQFVPGGAATDVWTASVPAIPASILMMFTARPVVCRPAACLHQQTEDLKLRGVP